ncbi:hypothetical protein NQ317_011858 [Molorchus minor]|uniref:Uncharacterized protein n=1 Tax=Molorchus minor TaxID=1323400 RepID=A0ABQ9JLX7_9CUCU|nr:hypothetical protein NQ317_011858 [Molorchus minor]
MEQEIRENKYGRRIIPVLPWLPEVRPEWESEASYVFRRIDRFEYPLYSLTSHGRKEVKLQPWRPGPTRSGHASQKEKATPGPFGLDVPRPENEEGNSRRKNERRRAEEKKRKLGPGFVRIEDLLNGEYWRKKNERKAKREKEKEMKKKLDLMQWEGFPDESEKLEKLQAILPKTPDEQKEYLYSQAVAETNVRIREKDVDRMIYYLTEAGPPWLLDN